MLGGSFNPVHIGHLLLADYMVQFTDLDEVWMMLSPRNPLKAACPNGPTDLQRLAMLEIACSHVERVKATDVELSMPVPSYSVNSLRKLSQEYPDVDFRLIIGSDNWLIFDKWKDYKEIIEKFSPIIYPRPGYELAGLSLPKGMIAVPAPMFEISSTFIRESIAAGKDMSLFMPQGVNDYINEKKLYGKG